MSRGKANITSLLKKKFQPDDVLKKGGKGEVRPLPETKKVRKKISSFILGSIRPIFASGLEHRKRKD